MNTLLFIHKKNIGQDFQDILDTVKIQIVKLTLCSNFKY